MQQQSLTHLRLNEIEQLSTADLVQFGILKQQPDFITLPLADRQALAKEKFNLLNYPAEPVPKALFGSPKLMALIDRLTQIKRATNGVGISANQVGVNARLSVIEISTDNPRYPKLANYPPCYLINPQVLAQADTAVGFWHGCLSAACFDRGQTQPLIRGLTWTYEWIRLAYVDHNGKVQQRQFDGIEAIVVQHELCHLRGSGFLFHATAFTSSTELATRNLQHDWPIANANDVPILPV